MKYISPGGWFSLEYPATWSEFEDTEDTFLFYNPNKWSGNFRISAYRDAAKDYGRQCIAWELKNNPTSTAVKVGQWECAYSAETFQEEGAWYTTHIWVTGYEDLSFECSFTVARGGERTQAEEIIRSLQVRRPDTGKEVIPIRVLEIGEVNAAFAWVSGMVKKTLTQDFTSQEADLIKLQKLIDTDKLKAPQKGASIWESVGLVFGTIIENEMDGMTWVTVIDGRQEYPALQFGTLLIDPVGLLRDRSLTGQPCNLKAEFDAIKAQVEKLLED